MRWECLSNQQPYPPSRRRAAKRWLQGCSAAANPSCRGASGASLPRDAPSDAPDCLFVRRHRAYAPMVLPCMRADAVLMLLPAINSSSRDSARSDSTASPGASLDANSNLQASLRSEVPQRPTASNPAPNGRQTRPLHWSLATGGTPD